jgi:hypothetical protein
MGEGIEFDHTEAFPEPVEDPDAVLNEQQTQPQTAGR